MKPCSKCGETKPLSAYYRHPSGTDGYTQTCKSCKRDYATSIRLRNKVERPEVLAEYGAKYRDKFPLKRKAHVFVGNAIRDGRLFKGLCEVCGTSDKVHGHHDDYLKPDEVRWLCPVHHKEWHTEHGEAANAMEKI